MLIESCIESPIWYNITCHFHKLSEQNVQNSNYFYPKIYQKCRKYNGIRKYQFSRKNLMLHIFQTFDIEKLVQILISFIVFTKEVILEH